MPPVYRMKWCRGSAHSVGAAAALHAEYTLPGVSQSVVITRMAGGRRLPEKESVASFAKHGATMVVFLSTSYLEGLPGAAPGGRICKGHTRSHCL